MNKQQPHCPVCGSEDVIRFERPAFEKLTLGPEFTFNEVFFKCNSCGEEADYFAETDKHYLISKKKAQAQLVKNVIEKLEEYNITMAAFERIFDLPTRTLTRWKNGDFSSSTIALLRIIITYPWILEIAENRFSPESARSNLIRAAAKEFEMEAKNLRRESQTVELKSGSPTSSKIINFSDYQRPQIRQAN